MSGARTFVSLLLTCWTREGVWTDHFRGCAFKHVATVLAYGSAWLGGNGCIPLNYLMEDAATAEIARVQLWQWVHYGARDDTGTTITAEYVGRLIDATAPGIRKAVPTLRDDHLRIVAKYLKDQVGHGSGPANS